MIANTLSKTVRTMLRNRSKSSSRMRSKSSSRMLRKTVPSKIIASSLVAAAAAVVFSAGDADARTRLEVRLRGSDGIEPQGAARAMQGSSTMGVAPAPNMRGGRRPLLFHDKKPHHHAHQQPPGVVTGQYGQQAGGELVDNSQRQNVSEERKERARLGRELFRRGLGAAEQKAKDIQNALVVEESVVQHDMNMMQEDQYKKQELTAEHYESLEKIGEKKAEIARKKEELRKLERELPEVREHERELKQVIKENQACLIGDEEVDGGAPADGDSGATKDNTGVVVSEAEKDEKLREVREAKAVLAREKKREQSLLRDRTKKQQEIQALKKEVKAEKRHDRAVKKSFLRVQNHMQMLGQDALDHRKNEEMILNADKKRELARQLNAEADEGDQLREEAAAKLKQHVSAQANQYASAQQSYGDEAGDSPSTVDPPTHTTRRLVIETDSQFAPASEAHSGLNLRGGARKPKHHHRHHQGNGDCKGRLRGSCPQFPAVVTAF